MKFKSASSNPRVASSNPWVHVHESVCEADGGGSEELKKCPPPSSAVLWFVNVRKRKPR